MDWMEQELKSALARKEPPPGFAEGVARALAAEGSRPPRKVAAWPSRAMRGWLAAAAAIVLLVGGGAGYRWRQGMAAKRQVLQAFAIAGGQLNHLHAHLKEVSQ